MRVLSTVVSILLLTPLLGSQGRVWVVDDGGGPGVDFTDLPDAVNAAGEGDVLLIRALYSTDAPRTLFGSPRAPLRLKAV